MDISNAENIVDALKALVSQIAPEARFVSKYGGVVICPEPDNDKKFVGGIFTYKTHVSLEFSEGATLNDPNGKLEGSGKKRRHLKFATVDDIDTQQARDFLKQVFS